MYIYRERDREREKINKVENEARLVEQAESKESAIERENI